MAEKATVGFLPGSDPESAMANLAYQEALNRMQSALDARQNRFFDPTMLAITEGLLGPGAGPTFGGAIGNVAAKLKESQALQEKEEREIAQAQLGLAGRGIEIERLRQREREFGRFMGDGALPTSGQAGGALPGPKGFENIEGIRVSPPNPNFMSGRQYLGMARLDPNIPITTAMKEAQKMEQDRFQVKESGVQDLSSGLFYPFPKGEQVTRQLFGYEGLYSVDARTAALLDMYAANGDPRYHELAKRVIEGPKAAPKPSESKVEPKEGEPAKVTAPAAPGVAPSTTPGAAAVTPSADQAAKPTRLMSKEELDALAAGAQEQAKLEAKRLIGEKSEYLDAGRSVTPRLANITMLNSIASGKDAKSIFGVFERPEVAAAFAKLIEGGLGTKNLALTMPGLRAAFTQVKLPQHLINQAQMAYSLMAQVQLETAKLGSGQGSVSNFERDLFAQASIAATDNPEVILAKLDMLRARANLDKARSELVRKHRGNLDDLVESDQWSTLTTNYLNEINQIFGNRLAGAPVSKNAQPNYPAVPGRDNAGARERLPSGV